MLYAAGEILILIIGILIALQVNNWNEERQISSTEIEMLIAIRGGLKNDLVGVNSDIRIHEIQVESSEIILDHLENDLAFHDSLTHHFSCTSNYTVFFANRGPYQTLLSTGVSIISNAKLRDSLVLLYDGMYEYMRTRSESMIDKNEHVENFIFDKRFDEAVKYDYDAWWESGAVIGSMVPLDYEGLKGDKEYLYALKTLRNHSLWYIADLKFADQIINQVISQIDFELERLDC